MNNRSKLNEQEWSHFFNIDEMVKGKASKVTIEANEEQCANMARRFDVVELKDVTANLSVAQEGGRIHVSGEFRCIVTQNCVVTLEAFDTTIIEPVEGWFADKQSTVSFAAKKREREMTYSQSEVEIIEEKDDPEDIINGTLDLGELVAQHISLAIPAYPHKDGAVHKVTDENMTLDENSPLRKNPFEALKDWKEER